MGTSADGPEPVGSANVIAITANRGRVPVRPAMWVAIAFGALLIAVWLFRLGSWLHQGGLPVEFNVMG